TPHTTASGWALMPTPTHCAVCRAVLAEDSPSGLCPTCQRSATPHDASSVLLADDSATTRTFSDRVDPAAETRPAPPLPNPRLARHRIPAGYVALDELGHGGMGHVYKVWEVDAERVVALKLMRAGFGEELRARFGVEVKVLAGLDHPNIVRVLTVDLT